jgi:hypothetical protein
MEIIEFALVFGFITGVFLAVVFGAIRLGWQLAPWIVGIGAIVYLFNQMG